MKQVYLNSLKKIGFFSAVFLFATGAFASLSGTYTIDKGSAASSTNYQSFASFVSDLKSGTRSDAGTSNGPGISASVIVNVVAKSGPYSEQVTITAITGVSASATITIMGNGETLQHTATSSTNAHTLKLDGADYITIDGLNVVCLSSSIGRGIWLTNSADNNVIKNCVLNMPNMTSTSNNNAYICLTVGTSSMLSYGDPGENNVIMNNKTGSGVDKGPYSGISIVNESSGSTVHPNIIRNNEIKDWYYAGVWGYYPFQQTISNNDIHNTGSGRSGNKNGVYMYNYNKGGNHKLDSNYIHDLSTYSTSYWYGIYNYAYYGTGTGGISIKGNKIYRPGSTYYTYGIYNSAYNNYIYGEINVNDNEVKIDYNISTSYVQYGIYNYCYYSQNASNVNVIGNKIDINSQRYAYGIMNYLAYSNFSKDCIVANNILNLRASYDAYGIYTYAYNLSSKVHYLYNTIYSGDHSSGVASGYKYLYYPYYTQGDFKNNILECEDGGGTTYCLYYYPGSMKFDYNNFFTDNAASTLIWYDGSTQYNSFNDYKAAMGGKNDISVDPVFVDQPNGDLTPTAFNMVNKGTPVKEVTDDYFKINRNSSTPDIGAIEFYIDVALSNFTFSGKNVCGGYKESITVTVTNNNAIAIKDVPLAYDVNGVRKVMENVTATIGPGKSADFTFNLPVELNFPGTNIINVYLDGSDDQTTNNLVTATATVVSSPYGGELSENSSFPGYFRQGGSGGLKTNPDVTIPDLEIAYDINNPTNHPTSTYGSAWDMKGVYMTSGGMPITTGVSYTAPSGSTLGKLTFKPTAALMDSMVFIGVTATNKTTLCDSTFGRWVYVPHAPNVDFSFKPACDGEVIEFKNLTTIAKGIILYDWQFNDPNNNEDATDVGDPVFKYSSYGSYTTDLNVKLAAYPKFVFTKSYAVTVTPVPTIDFKVYNACEKLPVTIVNDTKLPVGVVGNITYTWNFGGAGSGDPVTTKSPKYTYSKAGGYQITLTAVSNGCASTLTKNANQFALPKASFTKSGTCNLEEINFTNNSSIAIGNTGFTWDFGDNSISNIKEPKHIFQTPGAKTVKLMAISEFGCKDSSSVTFNLAESPKADFTYSDPCNLTAVKFSRTGTVPTGVNSIYEWDFSGETTSTNENPSHLFNTLGFKDVSLIVRSANGCTDQITKSFPVKLQSKAAFTTIDVCEGQEVAFTNASTVAAGNLVYEWRFGDGNTSLKTSPKHSYNVNGNTKTYLVTLVANVPGGCSDSITRPVTVNAASNAAFTVKVEGRNAIFTQTTTDVTNAYNWRFGDGSSAQTINPTYSYSNVDKGTFQACLGIINASGCLSESCNPVTINLVSVNDINANGLNVYPNPSTGTVNVEFAQPVANATINVFNLLGGLVSSTENVNGNSTSLNLNALAEGVYMIKVIENGTVSSQRIVITK
jgi:PKD repeat protein